MLREKFTDSLKEAMKEKMKALTGGLPLPPGLKLF